MVMSDERLEEDDKKSLLVFFFFQLAAIHRSEDSGNGISGNTFTWLLQLCIALRAIHRRHGLERLAYCELKHNQGRRGARIGWHNILSHLHPQPQALTCCKNPSINAKSCKFSSSCCRKELGIYAAIYAAAAIIVRICLSFTHIPLWKKKSYSKIGKSVSAPTLVISIRWGCLVLNVTLFINTVALPCIKW